MIRMTGRYLNQKVELDKPLALPEGTAVEIAVHVTDEAADEREDWAEVGMSRLEEECDNPEDAAYDDWKNSPPHQNLWVDYGPNTDFALVLRGLHTILRPTCSMRNDVHFSRGASQSSVPSGSPQAGKKPTTSHNKSH